MATQKAEVLVYCFDLDGTICSPRPGDYDQAEPFPDVVEEIHRLRAAGHRIKIWTARGTETGIDWRATTEDQLARWGVPYDELGFGKPAADIYIDDRAINAVSWRHSRFTLDPRNVSHDD